MPDLIRHNKKNPCPNCGSIKSQCATNRYNELLYCYHGEQEVSPGYRFIKSLDSGMGGLLAVKDFSTAVIGSSKPRKKKIQPKKSDPTFTDAYLAGQYQEILTQSTLAKPHREWLQGRGLTLRQMELVSFISNQNHKVEGIDTKLNIFNSWGNLKGARGILLPIKNPKGQPIGFQVKPDSKGFGKYIYVKNVKENRKNSQGHQINCEFGIAPDYRRVQAEGERTSLYLDVRGDKVLAEINGVGYSKVFKNLTRNQLKLNALLLGLQMAYEQGETQLAIHSSFEWLESLYKSPEVDTEKVLSRLIHRFDVAFARHVFLEGFTLLPDYPETDQYFDNRTVYLCDGILKTPLAAFRHGVTVLGCPMNAHATNEQDFEEYLKLISPEKVILAPDAGDVENQSNVPRMNLSTLTWAQGKGYNASVLWWGQRSKNGGGDIDEIDSLNHQRLTSKEFLALHPPATQDKLDPNGFHRPGIYDRNGIGFPHKIPTRRPRLYRKEERPNIWNQQLSGNKYLLDCSPTGTGKSFDVNNLDPGEQDVHQIFWVSNDPISLEYPDWEYYRARDNGRYLRPSDQKILREQEEDSLLFKESNCTRADYSQKLQQAQIVPDVTSVCLGCEHYNSGECQNREGWYLHDKEKSLNSRKLRLHPSVLRPEILKDRNGKAWGEKSNEPGAMVVLDDVAPWVSETEVSKEMVKALVDFINYSDSIFLSDWGESIYRMLRVLHNRLDERRIMTNSDLKEDIRLPDYGTKEQQNALYAIIQSALLSSLEGHGTAKDTLKAQWLPELFEALQGGGILRIFKGKLYISKVNQNVLDAITHPAVSKVLILDATSKVEELEEWLAAYHDEPIPFISSMNPEKKSEIKRYQVTGLSTLGHSRTPLQKKIVREIYQKAQQSETPIVDTKKSEKENHFEGCEAAIFHASARGSNKLKNENNLFVIGTPLLNLGAVAAEYHLRTGREVDTEARKLTAYPMPSKDGKNLVRVLRESSDEDFASFYYQKVANEIIQAEGRLRANNSDNIRKLKVIYFTDFPLPFEVDEITTWQEWAEKEQISTAPNRLTLYGLIDTMERLHKAGHILTQATVASFLDVSPSTLCKMVRGNGLNWSSLRAIFEDGSIYDIEVEFSYTDS